MQYACLRVYVCVSLSLSLSLSFRRRERRMCARERESERGGKPKGGGREKEPVFHFTPSLSLSLKLMLLLSQRRLWPSNTYTQLNSGSKERLPTASESVCSLDTTSNGWMDGWMDGWSSLSLSFTHSLIHLTRMHANAVLTQMTGNAETLLMLTNKSLKCKLSPAAAVVGRWDVNVVAVADCGFSTE